VRDTRPNKGTILKSSVDYIKCLKHEINRLRRAELKQKEMEQVNKRLMQRVQELETERHEMPQQTSAESWQFGPSTGANSHQQTEFSSEMNKVSECSA
jgi:hypothetical protein